ncbi:peroxisome proliferator-activated receptor gamma coactivator 1-beta-like isoform X2 [Narcine bancroftii]
MADCSLTDEDFSSFVFNYLTESAESQYGSVAGEDRFYSDFPEIDLSQLDVADLDSVSCLSELHWDNDQTEKSSSQYSTDDSELFETIEEENEALLAALTETLDDIQVDDVSLSAFKELTDGVVTELLETASLPTPDGSPPNTKADEPSLLKKLLLAPQDAHLNYERQKEISTVRHASGSQKSKSQRSFKVDSPQGSKPRSSCQIQHRPFSELHKHLTSTVCPPLFKTEDSKITNKDQSHPVWTSQYHQSHHQQGESEDDGDVEDDCVNGGANKELDCISDGNGEHKQGHSALQNGAFCIASIKSEDTVASANNNWTKNSQFTTEAELCSVVELIKYMHTYSLPPRKYPPVRSHQGDCSNESNKKLRSDCSLHRFMHPSIEKQKLPNSLNLNISSRQERNTPDLCKKKVRKLSQSSILRKLLEKNIAVDVSKPYRLHNPLYPALVCTHSSEKSHTVLPQVVVKHECDNTYYPETNNSTLKKDRKKCCKNKAAKMGGTVRKQENACLAVRRSLRLNPQVSGILNFDLESVSAESLTRKGLEGTPKTTGASNMQMRFEDKGDSQVAEIEIDHSGQKLCGAHVVRDDQWGLPSCNQVQWTEENDNEESSSTADLPAASTVPCSIIVEEHRAFTAQDFPLNETKMQENKTSRKLAKPTTLLLSPESESDCKEFPLDNKSFEQALSVELCGTAGLTPPTTPPHKTTRDDPFKTAIKINSSASNTNNRLPSKNHWSSLSKSLVNKHPEQTELYAYLSKATVAPIQMEGKKVKRSYTRCFGDHDYCQLYGSETEMEKNVLRLYELPNSSSHQNVKEECDNYALGGDKKQKMSPISNQGLNDKKMEISEKLSVQSSNNKPMRDQEIRDKLFEHFGYPEEAITDEEVKQNMLEDSDCVSNECCYNSEANLLKAMKKPGASSPDQNLSILLHKTEQSLPKDRLHAQEYQLDGERTMPSSNQQHKLNFGSPHAQARSPAKRESAR